MWRRDEIRAQELTLTVEEVTPAAARLRLDGKALLATAADLDKAGRGFEVRTETDLDAAMAAALANSQSFSLLNVRLDRTDTSPGFPPTSFVTASLQTARPATSFDSRTITRSLRPWSSSCAQNLRMPA